MANDTPFGIEDQILLMKKYVVFTQKTKMRRLLIYSGYFRISRYGKYLLSYTNVTRTKPKQDLLFNVYEFVTELRKLCFNYCKKAEIQFKSHVANSVALHTADPVFYLDDNYYTKSKGENNKIKKKSNQKFYPKFKKAIVDTEKKLRTNVNKYPEFKEYRTGGRRFQRKIPCWAAFSYFEFGLITNIYSYLRLDLRKNVLKYGYSRNNYGKEITKQMDTWLDAIRNLRNVCSHHNKLVGRTSSIVLLDRIDEPGLLISQTDLFSRIYALKKVLNAEDSASFQKELKKLINKAKFNIYQFNILPTDWEDRFDRINIL